MTPVDFFKREGNLPQCRANTRGFNCQRQVDYPCQFRRPGECVERGLDLGVVAFRLEFLQALDLGFADAGVVHFANVKFVRFFQAEKIDTDDGFLAGINARLAAGGGFLDAQLGQASFDGFGHPAERFDLLDMRPGAFHDCLRQRFHIIMSHPTGQ